MLSEVSLRELSLVNVLLLVFRFVPYKPYRLWGGP